MKKKKQKRNNQGFSLVELVVVVLIMGLLAVAMAPQVMKWVGKSQDNSITYNSNAIKSAALASIGDYESNGMKLKDSRYDVTGSGIVANGADQNEGLLTILNTYITSYPQVEGQGGKVYQIRCWQDGKKVDVVVSDGTY